MAYFSENLKKKVEIEFTGPKKAHFLRFSVEFTKNYVFRFCDLILTFLYRPFQSFVLMKVCVARTFLVELHLGVVLEVHLVVGSKMFTNLVDKYRRNIH